jgi:hypothetical protein
MPKLDEFLQTDKDGPMSPQVQMNVDARVAAGGWSSADEAAKTKAIASSTQQGIEEVMKNFLHSGTISEANLKLIIYQRDISRMIHLRDMVRGNTLLHVCAASGMLDEVRALLASGASPNEPNKQGLLPYHMTKSTDIRLVLGRKV